jgi:hypothetical protein
VIGTAKRFANGLRPSSPGPALYSTINYKATARSHMVGSHSGTFSNAICHSNNYSMTPGPGAYDNLLSQRKQVSFTRAIKCCSRIEQSPGPGHYSAIGVEKFKARAPNRISFGKEKKQLPIKRSILINQLPY